MESAYAGDLGTTEHWSRSKKKKNFRRRPARGKAHPAGRPRVALQAARVSLAGEAGNTEAQPPPLGSVAPASCSDGIRPSSDMPQKAHPPAEENCTKAATSEPAAS